MKQWYWPGKPDGYSNLQLRDVAIPTPGPGEVLVKIQAMSLNFRELFVAQDKYLVPIPDGITPGADAVGFVASVGEGVTQWTKGNRVVATYFLDDDGRGLRPSFYASAMGAEISGSLVEYRVFPASALLRIPDHMTYEQAATLPCAGLTAWSALHGGSSPLHAGQTVVVQGTGGVSILAAQIAVVSGARVIITSSSDEKLTRAKALGIQDTINYKTTPDWAKEVHRLTDGRGADIVLDVGGAATLASSLDAVTFGGQIVVIGALSGAAMPQDILFTLLQKNANMRGVAVGDIHAFRKLIALFELHKVQPVVGRVFDFEHAKEAYACLERQDFFSKHTLQQIHFLRFSYSDYC